MGFLAPWFLAGAATAALPFWIHLLRQYRSTPHPFSSLMFFERRTQSSIKHRRLRHLLLLSLRIALLLLMALAFANPFLNRVGAGAAGQRMLVVAVDNSFSMRYGDHLATAKRKALDILNGLHAGQSAQVLALASRAQFLTQPTKDPATLKDAIAAIQPTDERSSYAELARALRSIAETSKMPIEAHLISDMQKSSMPPSFSDLRMPSGTELTLDNVASDREPNWFVGSVIAPSHIYDPKRTRVQASIAGVQTEGARKTVSLVLDGRTLDSKTVDVPASGRASVEFTSLESPYGFHRGEVRVGASDRLAADDRFPFAIERSDPRRVLFLNGRGENRGILYYKTALESSAGGEFALEVAGVQEGIPRDISKYAFVVLSDIGSLPTDSEDALRNYVRRGGALLVALGPASAQLPRVPVSEERVLGSRYATRDGDRFQVVSHIDAEHPAVNKSNRLDGVEFYQSIRVDPGDSRVIASLSDGTPLLLEKRAGEGRVLVFASALDNVSNDFPLHASFLPFVEQSAIYLTGEQESGANLSVDARIDLRTADGRGTSVDVIAPDGTHPLSLKEASTALSFQLASEGYYEVHRANGQRELIAVHADRRESDLTPVSPDVLALWRNTGHGSPAAENATVNEQDQRWSLWRYALLLVLIVSILESLIADRYLGGQKEIA